MLTVAALAILGVSCSSSTPNGGSGGAGPGSGGASGGTVATSTGGSAGSGGATSTGVGGNGSGGNVSGGAGGKASGGSASGGSAAGGGSPGSGGAAGSSGAGSGGSGSGGTAGSGGSGRGGSGSGGSGTGAATASGGSGNGGSVVGGGSGKGGTGSGGSGSGGSGSAGSGSGGTTGTGGAAGSQTCPSLPGAPTGTPPLPSPAQLSYQRTEMTSFLHFGLSTFDGSEQCDPGDSPSIFNPTKLDATSVGQWVTALKGAGFRQTMLVTKHSCGFVLWPSKYTSYSVAASPWMSGKGDVLQLWTDAMKANDMRIAIYLSPWDSHYPSSKSDYQTYFTNLLTELYTYGNSYEFEFDGYHSIDQGSPNTSWKTIFQQIHQAQPNTLVWAGPEIVQTGATPDVQWIGNENGTGSRTTSSLDTSNCGGGNTWCPYECNTSSHRPNWFWHPGQNPIALADMQKNYFQTVGMNCTFNFNVPPSNTGEFDPKDISLLQSFGTWYSALYKTNLVKGQPATADSKWATGFDADKAVDDDICTYWAAASGKTSGTLEVTPASPITANLISIREAIELGERVKKYHVEIQQNGTWNTSPTDKSGTKIQGTVIGNRQLWQLNGAAVQAVRLVIDSAKDSPAIAEFGVY